jgi:hypothetical protein
MRPDSTSNKGYLARTVEQCKNNRPEISALRKTYLIFTGFPLGQVPYGFGKLLKKKEKDGWQRLWK